MWKPLVVLAIVANTAFITPSDALRKCKKPNEVYDLCPNPCPARECGTNKALVLCAPAPKPGSKDCRPGCRCADGFLKNRAGICIPEDECQYDCPKNETLDPCYSECPPRNCGINIAAVSCLAIDEDDCERKCRCSDGFLRNAEGVCILEKDCPPTCDKDEVYSSCTNSDCGPQKCSQLGLPIPCPRIDPKYCIKGCVCSQGLLRAANGTCIPKNECPSCRGDPNAVSGCGNCVKRCSNKNPVICPQFCELNGCDCKEGFVLDDSTGKCIRPNKCVSCNGDFNAQPGCDKNCTKRCPGPKPTECKCYTNGCECKDGFLYDPKIGKCIRPEQCTPPCGDNEVLSNCSNGGCGPWRCSDVGFKTGCVKMDLNDCIVGCVCKVGYVRDDEEVCIPVTDCPECNGDPNAIAGCGINCGRLCSNYKNAENISCIAVCEDNACDCRKGFVKDENINKCVRPEDCTKCAGANEMYDPCPPSCPPQTCESIGQKYFCPLMPTNKTCHGACRCKPNFLRNKIGECISAKDCPPVCKKHEVYSECINGGCQARNCSRLGQPVPCIKLDPKACIKGCVCEDGYLRARNGTCVPIDKCDNCNKPHEHYNACAPSCPPQTCESIGREYDCSPTAAVCRGACQCDKGYLRNKVGECIREKDCPPQCGENERLEDCPDWLCTAQTCDQLGYSIACPALLGDISPNATCPGRPGCVCIDNYVRQDGECIPVDECPSCGGDPNAVSGCGTNCGRLCSNYKKKNNICTLICKINSCDCTEGFVFDSNINKCVLPEDCTQVCGLNEVYDTCANGGCQKRNCSQVGQPALCIDPIKCIGGCVCQKGFLRHENGTCVPEKQCPYCNKPHEHYNACAPFCPPQTCESIGREYDCPPTAAVCRGACQCDKGYLRNKVGECIRKKDCLKCTGPNEHFSNDPACDNVCKTLSKKNQTNCPVKNKRCISKCYCDEGYARDANGICIPIDQCGVSCHGDPNAIPGCGSHCNDRCSNYKERVVACPLICLLDGCDCKPGYVFDDNLGKCVLPKDCTPVCGADEVYNACINGGCQRKNCSDLARPIICIHPKECIDGCLCKKGMLRADNGTCVPIYDCPTPVCPKNEMYDRCANGGCHRRKCSELTGPIFCKDPDECIGDCVCVKGYLRNEDGVCVPECECNPQCNKPHQVFDFCPSTCPPQTCESLDMAYICPIEWDQEPPCQPSCVCEEGYFFNLIGDCISEEDCLKCMGPHEYYSCGGACDNVCLTLTEQSQDDCPIVNVKCNEMCYCEEGYARNASDICIPIKDCPPSRCGPDERYEESPCQVCEPLTCSEAGMELECPPLKDDDCDDTPGCICKYGLVRNDDDVCIPISECPSETAVNVTEARARLDQGSIALAGKFLRYLVSSNPDANCVASPTSLQIPMAQLGLYAVDSVLQEILKLLNLNNTSEIKAIFPGLIAEFDNQTHVDFKEATKVYANVNNPLSKPFKRDSEQYVGAEAESVDFSKPEEVSNLINKWVEEETNGKIPTLVSPDMFNADTRLCLVNAIYFLGNWVKQFNPNDTEVKDFHKSNGETVPLEIMYQENTFNYYETDFYQVLEMTYRGDNFSFVVVLPRNKEDLLPTLEAIEEPGVWDKIMESLSPNKCKVSLPKFSIDTTINLKTMLKQIGVDKMFDPTYDGFEGMLEKPEPVYVSDAIQKAFISVDETGTEAAAATAVIFGLTAVMNPPKSRVFKATRPYAFYLLHRSAKSPYKTPLFCGTFVGAK